MSLSDSLIPVDNPFGNIDLSKLTDFDLLKNSLNQMTAPEIVNMPNPIHETNRILEEQNEKIDELSDKLENANLEISKQTKELQSIHYENMKLNAQINVLNKTIDSQNDELEHLRYINIKLTRCATYIIQTA